jgi:hypothetical protein
VHPSIQVPAACATPCPVARTVWGWLLIAMFVGRGRAVWPDARPNGVLGARTRRPPAGATRAGRRGRLDSTRATPPTQAESAFPGRATTSRVSTTGGPIVGGRRTAAGNELMPKRAAD